MKRGNFENIPRNGAGSLHFRDAVLDDLKLDGTNLPLCQFERVGLKAAVIRGSNLTQCLFVDVYLRLANFTEVDFTGTTFRNCNLERATFRRCNLRYCRFEHTAVDPHEIEENLPSEPNLRRDLARNLRKNFELQGDRKSADIFLTHEINAEEMELWARFVARTDYYRNKYNALERVAAVGKLAGLKISGLVWGYGYRIGRLVLSYIIITSVLALIGYFLRLQFADVELMSRGLSFWESMYQAFAETLGSMTTPFVPMSVGARVLQVTERFTGTVLLALLAAAAYRRIAR